MKLSPMLITFTDAELKTLRKTAKIIGALVDLMDDKKTLHADIPFSKQELIIALALLEELPRNKVTIEMDEKK